MPWTQLYTLNYILAITVGVPLIDIAVSLVNYNTAERALKATASVLEHGHPGHRVELHLIDKASLSGAPKTIMTANAERGGEGG